MLVEPDNLPSVGIQVDFASSFFHFEGLQWYEARLIFVIISKNKTVQQTLAQSTAEKGAGAGAGAALTSDIIYRVKVIGEGNGHQARQYPQQDAHLRPCTWR